MCRDVWYKLLNIWISTYKHWRRFALTKLDVLPLHHGLVCKMGNAAKTEGREAVVCFIRHITDYDGHPLPVRICAADKILMERIEGTEQMVVLSPRYTKSDLLLEYIKLNHKDSPQHILEGAFMYTLHEEIPWVWVSLRERGLCDKCFVFRESIRNISDQNLDTTTIHWKEHLVSAEDSTQIYRNCEQRARQAS